MKTELKRYHCVYYPNLEEYIVQGLNIEATSMKEAIKSFYAKFPNIEPLYILNLTNHSENPLKSKL